ncbi:MAG: hypothetical protein HY236_08460 [Acidobacteria bacterium]|nr:hypothetical protein [Acidobacteriota bacterium]
MKKALLALQLLVEGTSVRTTERITGLHRDTILRVLVLAGRSGFYGGGSDHRQPGPEAHLHVEHRAAELDDADADPPSNAPDERLQ